ncbi:hypothetical protein H6F67_23830 [Microcoleus sp. FACHB-1515]|uniref:hypothetical protein n=1 Tax=Cyanophyceae TaxID=3028117 RepID=UPI0016857498|nr:hypothetical protein [Microcoleus sp. FACHB-1515]MBD2092883.1 hypothetical protein [Microcoleus sp. FACHB-1515]
MKSQPQSDAVAQTTARSTASAGYAPSVPITVYRELAAELQATKTLLDSMNTQNQQLARHNQHLRQEIEQLAQSAINLRQSAEAFQPSWNLPPQSPEAANARSPRSWRPETASPGGERGYVIEQAEPRSRNRSQPSQREMSGVWLVLIIAAIVITAFGAGFLVVRPLLSQDR